MPLYGQQQPRYASAPECYTRAAAAEAADLMVLVGQPLDPWQRLVLDLWLGERHDGTWASFECALWVQRQNGKGGVTEARELGGLFLFGERKIIHTAHLLDTARSAFVRVVELVEGCADLTRRVRRIVRSGGEQAIELMSGAELQFRSRSPGSGRGLTCDCLVLDEALHLQAAQMEALVPTMLARSNAQMCYTSTPPIDADAHIVGVRDRGRAGDARLASAEWSNDEGVDIEDPAVRAVANPVYGRRITAESMEDVRRVLGEKGFARECIGIWPRSTNEGWAVIGEGDWLLALDEKSRPVGPVALGVAAAPDRSWAAICAAGQRADGLWHVEVTGRADMPDHRPGTAWVRGRAVEIASAHQLLAIAVADKAIADELELSGLRVHRLTSGDWQAACGRFFDAVAGKDVAGRTLRHLGQDVLTAAVRGATKRAVDSGASWVWERGAGSQVELSPVLAATAATWAMATPRVHIQRRAPAAAFVGSGPVERAPVGHPLGLVWPPPAGSSDPTCQKCRNLHPHGQCPLDARKERSA